MKTWKSGARRLTRRDLLKSAAGAGLAVSAGPFVHTRSARAAKTLRILQWSHFVPGYDKLVQRHLHQGMGRRRTIPR